MMVGVWSGVAGGFTAIPISYGVRVIRASMDRSRSSAIYVATCTVHGRSLFGMLPLLCIVYPK